MADKRAKVVKECESAVGRLRIFWGTSGGKTDIYNLVFEYQIYILLDNNHIAMLCFRKLMNCDFRGRVL